MTVYKDAGVDIQAANEALKRLKPLIKSTHTPGVIRDVGAFGGFFQLDLSGYKKPILVSSIDGVGTKVKVAVKAGVHDTVGEDLVNHCINDIAVCGAEPLYFLDYFAAGELSPEILEAVVQGMVRACKNAGIALIGGETAEMPDLYSLTDYDLAGVIVGLVDKDHIIDGSKIQKGDTLWGITSSGLHTNGYSLARKVLLGTLSGFHLNERPAQLKGKSIEEELLSIHKCYLSLIRDLKEHAHAFVHVTGGGIEGNTQRVLPEELHVKVDYESWERPPVFDLIQKRGAVPEDDMRDTFNLGIGLVVIAPASAEQDIQRIAAVHHENPIAMGSVY
ncbi:MAG: phosphoribosylformylglycinamidine cyclo-ligase [Rhodothermaceae bacterium]|nr:phosphoribosylformylglycinamidine cyclo-ligase [Rhodothermaceae bacterium]MYG68713.1 phosphoribosylformylglycinamidine cyclo-ligase [Rhodothermaceae bacterium]MYJ45519.1 phosphoribosylformylglycinamidine cyclo-ligase [Rhodothermaceae bacterium]